MATLLLNPTTIWPSAGLSTNLILEPIVAKSTIFKAANPTDKIIWEIKTDFVHEMNFYRKIKIAWNYDNCFVSIIQINYFIKSLDPPKD